MTKEDEDNLLKWLQDKDGVYNIREYFLEVTLKTYGYEKGI